MIAKATILLFIIHILSLSCIVKAATRDSSSSYSIPLSPTDPVTDIQYYSSSSSRFSSATAPPMLFVGYSTSVNVVLSATNQPVTTLFANETTVCTDSSLGGKYVVVPSGDVFQISRCATHLQKHVVPTTASASPFVDGTSIDLNGGYNTNLNLVNTTNGALSFIQHTSTNYNLAVAVHTFNGANDEHVYVYSFSPSSASPHPVDQSIDLNSTECRRINDIDPVMNILIPNDGKPAAYTLVSIYLQCGNSVIALDSSLKVLWKRPFTTSIKFHAVSSSNADLFVKTTTSIMKLNATDGSNLPIITPTPADTALTLQSITLVPDFTACSSTAATLCKDKQSVYLYESTANDYPYAFLRGYNLADNGIEITPSLWDSSSSFKPPIGSYSNLQATSSFIYWIVTSKQITEAAGKTFPPGFVFSVSPTLYQVNMIDGSLVKYFQLSSFNITISPSTNDACKIIDVSTAFTLFVSCPLAYHSVFAITDTDPKWQIYTAPAPSSTGSASTSDTATTTAEAAATSSTTAATSLPPSATGTSAITSSSTPSPPPPSPTASTTTATSSPAAAGNPTATTTGASGGTTSTPKPPTDTTTTATGASGTTASQAASTTAKDDSSSTAPSSSSSSSSSSPSSSSSSSSSTGDAALIASGSSTGLHSAPTDDSYFGSFDLSEIALVFIVLFSLLVFAIVVLFCVRWYRSRASNQHQFVQSDEFGDDIENDADGATSRRFNNNNNNNSSRGGFKNNSNSKRSGGNDSFETNWENQSPSSSSSSSFDAEIELEHAINGTNSNNSSNNNNKNTKKKKTSENGSNKSTKNNNSKSASSSNNNNSNSNSLSTASIISPPPSHSDDIEFELEKELAKSDNNNNNGSDIFFHSNVAASASTSTSNSHFFLPPPPSADSNGNGNDKNHKKKKKKTTTKSSNSDADFI